MCVCNNLLLIINCVVPKNTYTLEGFLVWALTPSTVGTCFRIIISIWKPHPHPLKFPVTFQAPTAVMKKIKVPDHDFGNLD